MRLTSLPIARSSHPALACDYPIASMLEVFFFQDDYAPPLDDRVAAALRSLDWSTYARDYD